MGRLGVDVDVVAMFKTWYLQERNDVDLAGGFRYALHEM